MNIDSLSDVADIERGLDVCRQELAMMHTMANQSQKSIFAQVNNELELNSMAIVSGAAGTGKSFVLRMFERHYKLQDYKVNLFRNYCHTLRNTIYQSCAS